MSGSPGLAIGAVAHGLRTRHMRQFHLCGLGNAIVDIFQGHHFVKSPAEAAAAAIKTGMDNECADFFTVTKDDHDYKPFVDAVKQGQWRWYRRNEKALRRLVKILRTQL